MRQFERHNTGIPVRIIHAGSRYRYIIENVSLGGMACKGEQEFNIDDDVEIEITLLNPTYRSRGRVVWCKEAGNYYELGIEHLGDKDKARLDMVEQISHIEHYRMDIMAAEGRELTGEQAAKEWIAKHTL